MNATLTHAWVLTQRELLHWARQPIMPVFNLAFSVMLLLMFRVALRWRDGRARRRGWPQTPSGASPTGSGRCR
ncbi:hypothetical protein [Microbacterium sp. Bi121]|uniref:hypothetical protein n=1 Tax=Microbacterium sp. Bi121 TaxID=2822348 RepID=UPI001D4A4702|nr:hypothetical protein [Microbacterium sp. Bi121]CAH0123185.1 hypothetical protein SRABI121_00364 [Microbacterium sp. Bi121]